MRIWHESLIPKLCRQHLLACWREGLGAYKIITEDKKGYRQHPAVKEFENSPWALWQRLAKVQGEMFYRGYHPKALPIRPKQGTMRVKEWQDLQTQIKVLKSKNCNCTV